MIVDGESSQLTLSASTFESYAFEIRRARSLSFESGSAEFYWTFQVTNVDLLKCQNGSMYFSNLIGYFRSSQLELEGCTFGVLQGSFLLDDSSATLKASLLNLSGGLFVNYSRMHMDAIVIDMYSANLLINNSDVSSFNSKISVKYAGVSVVNSTWNVDKSTIDIYGAEFSIANTVGSSWSNSRISVDFGKLVVTNSDLQIGPNTSLALAAFGYIEVDASRLTVKSSSVSNNDGISVMNGGRLIVAGDISTSNVTQSSGTASSLQNGTINADTFVLQPNSSLSGSGVVNANLSNSGTVSANTSASLNITQLHQTQNGTLGINVDSWSSSGGSHNISMGYFLAAGLTTFHCSGHRGIRL